jgi:hypothetical protein
MLREYRHTNTTGTRTMNRKVSPAQIALIQERRRRERYELFSGAIVGVAFVFIFALCFFPLFL